MKYDAESDSELFKRIGSWEKWIATQVPPEVFRFTSACSCRGCCSSNNRNSERNRALRYWTMLRLGYPFDQDCMRDITDPDLRAAILNEVALRALGKPK